jgi:preprotein translocase subunit YajC
MSLSSAVPFFVAQQPAPAGGAGQIIFLVLMFAAMYFLMIAPQRKKAKQHAAMLDSLSTGDQIVTAGGIYGEITNKKEAPRSRSARRSSTPWSRKPPEDLTLP